MKNPTLWNFVDIQVWHIFIRSEPEIGCSSSLATVSLAVPTERISPKIKRLMNKQYQQTPVVHAFLRNSTPSTVSTHLNRTSRTHCPTSTLDVAFDWHSSYHSSPRIAVLLMLWRLDPKPLYNCLNRGQSQNTLTLELLAGLACIIFWWEKTRQRIEMDFDLQPSGNQHILVQLSLARDWPPAAWAILLKLWT